jgi:hypothetical protein
MTPTTVCRKAPAVTMTVSKSSGYVSDASEDARPSRARRTGRANLVWRERMPRTRGGVTLGADRLVATLARVNRQALIDDPRS